MSPQLWRRSTSPCRMPTHRVLSQDTPKSHTLSHRKQCSKKENGMLVSLAIRACRGEQQLKHQINQASAKRGTKSLFSLNFVFEEWGIWKSILTWFVSIFHGGRNAEVSRPTRSSRTCLSGWHIHRKVCLCKND